MKYIIPVWLVVHLYRTGVPFLPITVSKAQTISGGEPKHTFHIHDWTDRPKLPLRDGSKIIYSTEITPAPMPFGEH